MGDDKLRFLRRNQMHGQISCERVHEQAFLTADAREEIGWKANVYQKLTHLWANLLGVIGAVVDFGDIPVDGWMAAGVRPK